MIARQAVYTDIPGLLDLINHMRTESNYKSITIDNDKVTNELKQLINQNQYVSILEHDNELIGSMVGYIQSPWFSNDLIGYDHGVYIKPDYRDGRNVLKLVMPFIEWCKSNNVKQIRPGISTGNDSITRLYERLGFVVTGSNFLMEI
jgi:L-amino acid N-acyltransferase YncA